MKFKHKEDWKRSTALAKDHHPLRVFMTLVVFLGILLSTSLFYYQEVSFNSVKETFPLAGMMFGSVGNLITGAAVGVEEVSITPSEPELINETGTTFDDPVEEENPSEMTIEAFPSSNMEIMEEATSTSCGTVSSSLNLTSDVNSSGTCFTINASNLVLDCKGYSINYSQSGTDKGISIQNVNNITITNCNLFEGASSGDSHYAISLQNSSNNTIYYNNITTTQLAGYGIWMYSASGEIINNSILTFGVDGMGMDISHSSGSLIMGNYINTSGNGAAEASYGIHLQNSSSNQIRDNEILTSGSSAAGIVIVELSQQNSSNNLFLNNHIYSLQGYEISDSASQSGGYNLLIYNNSFGQIRWLDNGTGSFLREMSLQGEIGLGTNLLIEENLIELNSSEFIGNINSSAQITFYNLTGWGSNDPTILKNGLECNSPECNVTYWDNGVGTLVVNVTGFSNYSAEDGGDPLTNISVEYVNGTYLRVYYHDGIFNISGTNISIPPIDGYGGYEVLLINKSGNLTGDSFDFNIDLINLTILNASNNSMEDIGLFVTKKGSDFWYLSDTYQCILHCYGNVSGCEYDLLGGNITESPYFGGLGFQPGELNLNYNVTSGILNCSYGGYSGTARVNEFLDRDYLVGVYASVLDDANGTLNLSRYEVLFQNFTYNTIASPASECGTLTTNTILHNNVSSNQTCFQIGANNVTLNCNGYTIRYALNNSGYSGVSVIGYNHTTIKNCLFEPLNDSIITNSINLYQDVGTTIYGNDFLLGNRSVAISQTYGSNGRIYDNFVNSSSYNLGAFSILATNHSNVFNNEFYLYQDEGQAIIIDGSVEGPCYNISVYNNNITAYGQRNTLLVSEFSNHSMIYNNQLTQYGSGSSLCVFGSWDDLIYDNWVNNTGSNTTTGISVDDGAFENSIYNNQVYGSNNQSISVKIENATNNTFTNNLFSSQWYDIASINYGDINYFLNDTFNDSRMLIRNGTVVVQWYVLVNVTDDDEAPLSGANVSVYRNNGSLSGSGLTNSSGLLLAELGEFYEDGDSRYYLTPHTFNVTKSGYNYSEATLNLSQTHSTTYNFVLVPPGSSSSSSSSGGGGGARIVSSTLEEIVVKPNEPAIKHKKTPPPTKANASVPPAGEATFVPEAPTAESGSTPVVVKSYNTYLIAAVVSILLFGGTVGAIRAYNKRKTKYTYSSPPPAALPSLPPITPVGQITRKITQLQQPSTQKVKVIQEVTKMAPVAKEMPAPAKLRPAILETTKNKMRLDLELMDVQLRLNKLEGGAPSKVKVIQDLPRTAGQTRLSSAQERAQKKEYEGLSKALLYSLKRPYLLLRKMFPRPKSARELQVEELAKRQVVEISRTVEGNKPRPANELEQLEEEIKILRSKLNEKI
jgi:hypothetical protein